MIVIFNSSQCHVNQVLKLKKNNKKIVEFALESPTDNMLRRLIIIGLLSSSVSKCWSCWVKLLRQKKKNLPLKKKKKAKNKPKGIKKSLHGFENNECSLISDQRPTFPFDPVHFSFWKRPNLVFRPSLITHQPMDVYSTTITFNYYWFILNYYQYIIV